MNSNHMSDDKKRGLEVLIKWYWNTANEQGLIHKSDFEFMYSLWDNGVSFYADEVQERLNRIREIYVLSNE